MNSCFDILGDVVTKTETAKAFQVLQLTNRRFCVIWNQIKYSQVHVFVHTQKWDTEEWIFLFRTCVNLGLYGYSAEKFEILDPIHILLHYY